MPFLPCRHHNSASASCLYASASSLTFFQFGRSGHKFGWPFRQAKVRAVNEKFQGKLCPVIYAYQGNLHNQSFVVSDKTLEGKGAASNWKLREY